MSLKSKFAHFSACKTSSANRRIFVAMFIVVTLSGIAKLIVAARELVVADYFGTSALIDAFLIAFLLPLIAINVLAGSFSAAMMPTYIRVRTKLGVKAGKQLFSSINILATGSLAVATFTLALLAPLFLPFLTTGFDENTKTLTQSLFYWLLPVLLITGISHLFASAMNAGEKFSVVALTPVITPMCTVVFVVYLFEAWGIYALVGGALLGSLLELLTICIVASLFDIPIWPKWCGMTDDLRLVIKQYMPMIAGAFLMSGTMLVDQTMAAMLDSGSVAALNYANKVVGLILSIGALALGAAVLPYFSRMVVEEDWVGINDTFRTYAKLIVVITVPITIALFAYSEPIVQLLFERGAFSEEDTSLVGNVQAFYLLQIPFYVLGILGVRLLSALARNEVLMKISFVNLIVNIVGNYILIQYFGVAGIALSTAIVYTLSFVMVYFSLFGKAFRFRGNCDG